MGELNSVYFSKKAVENGDFQEFLNILMKQCYTDNDDREFMHFNDIHIFPCDCEAFIIEWVQKPWSGEYGGRFEYCDEEQVPMKAYDFPDNHFEYFASDKEYEEALKDWLEENPGWHQHGIMNTWVKDDEY